MAKSKVSRIKAATSMSATISAGEGAEALTPANVEQGQESLTTDPEPESDQLAADPQAENEPGAEQQEDGGNDQSGNAVNEELEAQLLEFFKPYIEHYPACKVFYMTADEQVFLEANKTDAMQHQKSIDPSLEVLEYRP